jgi:hypothetical protein
MEKKWFIHSMEARKLKNMSGSWMGYTAGERPGWQHDLAQFVLQVSP